MKHRYVYLAICGALLGCSKDRPAESAYDDQRALTPASGTYERPQAERVDARPEREPSTSSGVLRADDADDMDAPSGTAPRYDGATAGSTAPAPDNTEVNQRDRDESAKTPLDQGNNEADLRITQQIRQAVQADDSLSFTAKNVKIISTGGKVTLRGPVNSAAERNAIEEAARKVAGVLQVDNQIEIKK